MIISLKDGLKLIAISIVCCCAVFVCTFMLNFYLDVLPLGDVLVGESNILYDAQLAMAKFTSAISGGFLALIAAVMTAFYIRLYVNGHLRTLGVLKATGYSDISLSARFSVFGLSVFTGCAVGFGIGFAAAPHFYKNLAVDGIDEIPLNFHPWLFVCLVIVPTVVFSLLSCLSAYFVLRRPVSEMLRGEKKRKAEKIKESKRKERSFTAEMALNTLSSNKLLAFFTAFASFCFAAMVQMGLVMDDYSSGTMAMIILGIGLILATVSVIMAITLLINANSKNVAVMKTFGYFTKECLFVLFISHAPFALLGFAVGTVYQYGLLKLMIDLLFRDVGGVSSYAFDISAFFITLALFVVACAAVVLYGAFKIKKVSVKQVMAEL